MQFFKLHRNYKFTTTLFRMKKASIGNSFVLHRRKNSLKGKGKGIKELPGFRVSFFLVLCLLFGERGRGVRDRLGETSGRWSSYLHCTPRDLRLLSALASVWGPRLRLKSFKSQNLRWFMIRNWSMLVQWLRAPVNIWLQGLRFLWLVPQLDECISNRGPAVHDTLAWSVLCND